MDQELTVYWENRHFPHWSTARQNTETRKGGKRKKGSSERPVEKSISKEGGKRGYRWERDPVAQSSGVDDPMAPPEKRKEKKKDS